MSARTAIFALAAVLPLSGCVVRTGLGDDVRRLFGGAACCDMAGPATQIAPPHLSADGRLVVMPVQYRPAGETRIRGQLALYSVAARRWREVAVPENVVVTGAVFSADDRWLAVSTFCQNGCEPAVHGGQIAVAELPPPGMPLALRFLTHGDGFERTRPVFSADGKHIAYAARKILWRADGGFTPLFENIAVVSLDGTGGEKFLAADDYLAVYPAGFSTAGDVIYTAIGPHGGTRDMVKSRLDGTPDQSRWIAMSIPYAAAMRERSQPRLVESFGSLDATSLYCAAGCDVAITIARRDPAERRYHYELFLFENGISRRLTHFDRPGAPLRLACISANGKQALVVNGGVPTLVDTASGEAHALPVPDFLAGAP